MICRQLHASLLATKRTTIVGLAGSPSTPRSVINRTKIIYWHWKLRWVTCTFMFLLQGIYVNFITRFFACIQTQKCLKSIREFKYIFSSKLWFLNRASIWKVNDIVFYVYNFCLHLHDSMAPARAVSIVFCLLLFVDKFLHSSNCDLWFLWKQIIIFF